MRPLLAALASVGLFLQLCVSGCAVGPSYRKPTTTLENFHSAAAMEARSTSALAPALEIWWGGFNDPMLSHIVLRAREQNLDLAAALARVQQARAAAREAGAQLLPTIDLNGQATRIRESLESPLGQIASLVPAINRDQSLYDAGLGASWELDLFGGLRRGREAASAEAQAAIAQQVGIRISVTADAADAYLRIRGDQARIAVAEQQVATDEHLLNLVHQRFGRGLAAVREVAQAEALLSQARASLQPLRIDLEAQMNRLDVLLGVQPGTSAPELQSPRDIPSVPSVSASDGPLEVLRRRPDVIAAERRLAASNARIGQALADYYPKISLAGVLGYESSRPSDLFKAATFQPQGIAGLRWRVFDFGKVSAEVAQARGAEAEALARYQQAVLRAAEEVENAFTSLVQLEAHQQELLTEVAALTRARDASQKAYQGGVIALTDVLDADRQLLNAQDELAQTRADSARAAVGTFRALGGGW
ncbi:MAG TPA: TolC family protein [Steroidobacteraceae bacterium]|jgi:NodT family efflux transporter outer membrane factor (OMF) lipoprotein